MTTTPDDTDQELVRRVQAGDQSAFNLLVLKYQHRVLKLVGRFVNDPTEAEDVAQEAFLKAYRALASFRGDSLKFFHAPPRAARRRRSQLLDLQCAIVRGAGKRLEVSPGKLLDL